MNLQITDTLGYTLKANINSLFKRHIHGFYFEQEHTLNEKFSVKQGLRTEYVIREINYEKLNEQVTDPDLDDSIEDPDLVLKLLLDERLGNKSRRVDKPSVIIVRTGLANFDVKFPAITPPTITIT